MREMAPGRDSARKRGGAGVLAAALLLSMAILPARAETYPDHTIKFVVPQPPGGGADILARQLADGLGQLSGQPIVIENKPGAGGTIGTQAVAAARPDGYTLLYATSNMLSGNFFLYKNLPYTADDFEAVTTVNRSPFVLVVAGNSPFHSVADLTAFLKAKNGAATYGTPTSISLASTEIYLDQAGVTARRIPYKASAMAVNDLISGDIDFFFIDLTGGLGYLKRGDIRALALTTKERSDSAPGVPTMAESGFKDYDMPAWSAVFVPAKTPEPIRAKLEGWFNEIVRRPETKEFLARQAADPLIGTAKTVMELVRRQTEQYRELAKAGKLDAQ